MLMSGDRATDVYVEEVAKEGDRRGGPVRMAHETPTLQQRMEGLAVRLPMEPQQVKVEVRDVLHLGGYVDRLKDML